MFIFFCGAYVQNVKGQALNISGDTVFVNREAEIQLVFPTHPKKFTTVPEDNQFLVWDSPTGINLIAGSESYDPVTLLISEAARKHRFILMYKKEIKNKEAKLYYDYSTEKKLAQHIRETTFPRLAGPQKAIVKAEPIKQDDPVKRDNKQSKREIASAAPVDSSSTYYALLAEGDKNLQLQNYQEAKLNFDKAHTLRPQDIIPLQRLQEIKAKTGRIEKSANTGTDRKFLLITEDAGNKLEEKKYVEARDAYNQALQVKAGDVYATQQVKKINTLIAEENARKEKQNITNINNEKIAKAQKELKDKQIADEKNYDTAVRSGDNFFRAGDYENAKTAYNKALDISKKEWPKEQLNKINKIVIAQANEDKRKLAQQKMEEQQKAKADSIATPAELKKKYALAMANGKSSYLKNDLFNAKTFYEEALRLQPAQQEAANQLKIINGKLEDSLSDAEITDRYDRTIELADSQVNAKALESAVVTYKQALLIRPMESYPKKQLKYMYSELALIEKKRKEERERKYIDALAAADKAVAEKRYDDARSAYTMALSVHSDNAYAKKRLEIISYQMEMQKAKIEKLRQDSIDAVPPIKNTKRKRS